MMEKAPVVSVIIPTYGNPLFLKRTIESVRKQTFTDWELIVVDDNNPGTHERIETQQLLETFNSDLRIHYIQHARNMNGAAARNTAIDHAKGKYLAFLDSDDEYFPTRLEKCVQVMEQAPDKIGGVYTGCQFVRQGKTFNIIESVPAGNFLVETLACTFMFCTGSNIFMRAEIVKTLKFDVRFIRHQDYEFLVRFFESYDLAAIPEVLVLKNNENFNLPNVKKAEMVKKLYLEKFHNLIATQSEKDQAYIYTSQYIALANQAAMAGQWGECTGYWKIAKTYGRIPLKARVKLPLLKIRYLIYKIKKV